MEGAEVPAVGWDLRDGVHAGFQQPPERLRVVRPAGEATADADDGDGFVMARGGLAMTAGRRLYRCRGSLPCSADSTRLIRLGSQNFRRKSHAILPCKDPPDQQGKTRSSLGAVSKHRPRQVLPYHFFGKIGTRASRDRWAAGWPHRSTGIIRCFERERDRKPKMGNKATGDLRMPTGPHASVVRPQGCWTCPILSRSSGASLAVTCRR